MHIPGLSDGSLIDLHALIREALESDDRSADGRKLYGVRDYPDWRRQANDLEAEMRRRSIAFEPIDWRPKTGS